LIYAGIKQEFNQEFTGQAAMDQGTHSSKL